MIFDVSDIIAGHDHPQQMKAPTNHRHLRGRKLGTSDEADLRVERGLSAVLADAPSVRRSGCAASRLMKTVR